MKSKTEKLNKLFDEWEYSNKEYKNKFVKDGINNEELFNKAKHKILFITKEPNNPKQEAGDFREWWKEKLAYSFSFRIAEWSYGILNNFPEYDEIWKDNRPHDSIQQIAFMNLKKCGGGGSAEYDRMMNHANLNFTYLHKQIEIIQPDLIITGTSWPELRNSIFQNIVWVPSGYGIEIAKFKQAKVIDFYHPSSRTPPSASYSLLQNIISSKKFKSL